MGVQKGYTIPSHLQSSVTCCEDVSDVHEIPNVLAENRSVTAFKSLSHR